MSTTINLGSVAPKLKGEYDSSITYEKLNIIFYNGSTYIATKKTLGNLPTDSNFWQVLSLKGEMGKPGANGKDAEHKRSLGDIFFSFGYIPEGAILCDGSIIDKATYSDLYKQIKKENRIISENEWQNEFLSKKYCASFSEGTNDTNFRLPKPQNISQPEFKNWFICVQAFGTITNSGDVNIFNLINDLKHKANIDGSNSPQLINSYEDQIINGKKSFNSIELNDNIQMNNWGGIIFNGTKDTPKDKIIIMKSSGNPPTGIDFTVKETSIIPLSIQTNVVKCITPESSAKTTEVVNAEWTLNKINENNIKFNEYILKTGGNISGTLSSNINTGTYISGARGNSIINSTAPSGSYVSCLNYRTADNGALSLSGYQNAMQIVYCNAANIGTSQNSPSYIVTLLDNNGNTSFSGTVYGKVFQISSDKRYKKNIENISNSLNIISKITGYRYNLISDNDGKRCGVIAQEVKEVLPEAVRKNNEGYLTVDYNSIVAVLINSIKEQQKQIDDLKNKVNFKLNLN